jgi:hypothetical protein
MMAISVGGDDLEPVSKRVVSAQAILRQRNVLVAHALSFSCTRSWISHWRCAVFSFPMALSRRRSRSYLRSSGCPTLIKPIMLGELVAILGGEDAEASPRSSVAPTLQPSSRPPHTGQT